jgi:nitrogen fixation protein FixH
MKKSRGLQWPIGIAVALVLVIVMGARTIVETAKEGVQESDIYMTNYQNADTDANKLINARIAFNKKYNLEYLGKQLNAQNAQLIYKITTKDGKSVNDAKLKVIVTRPQTHNEDMTLVNPKIDNGIYSFETKLPGIGRWDVMASVEIGADKRFYNLKMDTRDDRKPIEY